MMLNFFLKKVRYIVIDKKRRILRFLLFLSFFLGSICPRSVPATPLEASSDNYFVSMAIETKNSPPSANAAKSDINARWFDDYPSKNNPSVYEFGLKLPWWEMTLDYRNRAVEGLHKGATSKRVKIGLFYVWVDGSIITGLASNDTIKYTLSFHEFALGKQFHGDHVFFTPKLGLNVIDAKMSLSGAGSNEEQAGLVPLPFLGFVLGGKLTDKLKLELDTRYSRFTSGGTTATFKETLLALSYDVNKYLTVSAGTSDFLFELDYSKSFTSAVLKVPQSSPFARVALRF